MKMNDDKAHASFTPTSPALAVAVDDIVPDAFLALALLVDWIRDEKMGG